MSHSELENLRYIIDEHEKVANQLEYLSQTIQNPEVRSQLQMDAESAKEAQRQLLTIFN